MPEQLVIEVVERAGGQGAQATQQRAPSVPAVQPRQLAAPRATDRAPSVPASEPRRPTTQQRAPSVPAVQPRRAVAPRRADDRVRQTREGIARVETVAGVAGQAAAGNVFRAAAQGIGRVAAVLGPLGVAAVAVTAAFGVVTLGIRNFAKVIVGQVNELAQFSGAIAQAQADSEVRSLSAQIRRAQRLGPDLARAEKTRSRFEESITDLGTSVLEVLLKIFNLLEPFVEAMISAVDFMSSNIELVFETLGKILLHTLHLSAFMPFIDLVTEAIKRWLDMDDDAQEDRPLVDAFIRQSRRPRQRFDINPSEI